MVDDGLKRIHERLDQHQERITRLEAQQDAILSRLTKLENLPENVNAIRSSLDDLRGRLSVWVWLLTLLVGGIVAAGFKLLER